MPRTSNAVDFWRGYALVTIFINHIPGIYYEIDGNDRVPMMIKSTDS